MLKEIKSRYAGHILFTIIECLMIFLYTDLSFADVQQGNWRWRNDDGDVYSATWRDSLNTPIIITDYENIRLRIENSFNWKTDTANISLRYTEDVFNGDWNDNGVWTKINGIDTGKFFLSPSIYILDTASYFNNWLFPPRDTFLTYRKTITFDYTDNYFMIGDSATLYELEYSIKPTLKIQPGSAYFFSLFGDTIPAWRKNYVQDYPVLMTPPVNWITQSLQSNYQWCYLKDVYFIDSNTGTAIGYGCNNGNCGSLIVRTVDGGKTWVRQSCPTGINDLLAVYFENKDVGVAMGYNGTTIKTTNGGDEWIIVNSETTSPISNICFINLDTAMAVGGQCDNTNCTSYTSFFFKTTDGGLTWTKKASFPNKYLSAVCFTSSDIGTIVGSDIILSTTNGGSDWTTQSMGINGSFNDVSFTDANNGTAVGGFWDDVSSQNRSLILRTTNGGTTWSKSLDTLGPYLYSVNFVDQNNGWAVGGYGRIFKTTDGGLNWTKLVSGTSRTLNAIHFVDNQTGWVVGDMSKILKTTNGGITTFIEEEKSRPIPSKFYLSQNYPNPFNPSTKISYTIPKRSNVNIKVFNLLGSEVAELVKGEIEAGYHSIDFNASDLPSGVYFYQLRTENFTATKKLLLLK
jgi:photosystem II stability/assembly factor-like uncharacterized protein